MDQVTKAKVQFRREQWKQLIIECQQSGLPVRTWCTQNGFREQWCSVKKKYKLNVNTSKYNTCYL